MSTETSPLILAVDLGTSGLKIALVTMAGDVVGWESQALPLILSADGGAEQSPAQWWQAFLSAGCRLLDRQPDARTRVVAVCCSTQGEGTVPVDRDGQPLANAILWMDMRGAEPLRRQLRGWVNIEGFGLSRLLRLLRLTGGAPSPTGKDPAGHMLFLRDHLPRIYEQTYKFLNVLDFMNLRLTGRFVASFDSIVTSWVTDNRDPNSLRYNQRLIDNLGVDRDKLPELVPCTENLEPLRPEVAEQLGVSPTVQVVAGSIDNTAAAIGSGAVADTCRTSTWAPVHGWRLTCRLRRRAWPAG